jgi:hypothetical protein
VKKPIAIAVCVLVGATTIGLFWSLAPSALRPGGAVRLGFAGYTNDPAGIRLARFALTNEVPLTIRRWGVVRIDYHRQYTNASRAFILGGAASLRPGQSETVMLPIPSNQGSWKVKIFCSRDGWKRRWHEFTGRLNSPLAPAWLHQPMLVEYSTSSDWIDE